MSAPFGGVSSAPSAAAPRHDVHAALAALPRPRKHYQHYYASAAANADMWHCPQGVHDFLRAYYHHKSADWPDNLPVPLAGWTAPALAAMPTYYVMDLDQTMAQTVAAQMPSAAQIAACRWLPDAQLRCYSAEYERTGFQGGLQWYRAASDAQTVAQLQRHAGRGIDVPSLFIAGASDWGVYQKPGDFESMRTTACTDLRGCHLLHGAGHWVQQEQPEAVVRLLAGFLQGLPTPH
jgi:pimeloyl-ACP methyl ester carboxylesterase